MTQGASWRHPGPAEPPGSGGAEEAVPEEIRRLLEAARRLADPVLTPLGGPPRGAVAADASGHRAEGSSVEPPGAPRLSACAEHVALCAAVAQGFRPSQVAIWSAAGGEDPLPCGVCRQVLAELAPGATLWVQAGEGPVRRVEVAELLPLPFGPGFLPGCPGTGPEDRPA